MVWAGEGGGGEGDEYGRSFGSLSGEKRWFGQVRGGGGGGEGSQLVFVCVCGGGGGMGPQLVGV